MDNSSKPNSRLGAYESIFSVSPFGEIEQNAEASVRSSFNPSEFFIPGWKGEGLITASAIVIKNLLTHLSIDALGLFHKSCSTNKSLKLQTYNEFLHFAEYTNKTLK